MNLPAVFTHREFYPGKAARVVLNILPLIVIVITVFSKWSHLLLVLILAFAASFLWAKGSYLVNIRRATRVELSNEGIRISYSEKDATFSSLWSEVTEYVRRPADRARHRDHIPVWEISDGNQRATIPHVKDHPQFQRIMFEHLPARAIPSRYRPDGRDISRMNLPIKEFSLIADEDRLHVDSATNKADIPWHDLLFIEEFNYPFDPEGGDGEDNPRIHICSRTDSFLLTKSWDRYEDIRRLALAMAPPTAIVVLAGS